MKPLQVRVLRSGYVLGKTKVRTVVELEAELIRRRTKDARVVPARDASYRKVAAALKVFQRQGISLGFIGNLRSDPARLNLFIRAQVKRRRSMTASEHEAILSRDPGYLAMRAKQEAELAAFVATFADEEVSISSEAAALGYRITSVWDFVNNRPHPVLDFPFTGSYERAYPLLVRHLGMKHHPRVREGIVRALTVKDGGKFVWQALLQELHQESDPEMKWVLANALKTAMPYRQRRKHPEIAAAFQALLHSNQSPKRTREVKRQV